LGKQNTFDAAEFPNFSEKNFSASSNVVENSAFLVSGKLEASKPAKAAVIP